MYMKIKHYFFVRINPFRARLVHGQLEILIAKRQKSLGKLLRSAGPDQPRTCQNSGLVNLFQSLRPIGFLV